MNARKSFSKLASAVALLAVFAFSAVPAAAGGCESTAGGLCLKSASVKRVFYKDGSYDETWTCNYGTC